MSLPPLCDLTVSIVNHGHWELVAALLDSIRANSHSINFEVYVVNNLIDCDRVKMLEARFPWAIILNNHKSLGFAANNNQVLRLGRGRYFLLLNDDMLLRNDALDRMVAFLDANPLVGAAGCKLLNRDGTVQRSCWRGFPSAQTLFVDLFYLSKWLPRLPFVQNFEATFQSAEVLDVDYVLGACLLVRHEVVQQVGMLDESFGMFLEETDWCFRMRRDGWRICWVPAGEILHYGQQSVSKDPARFLPMLYQNYCRFSRKYSRNRITIFPLKIVIALGTLFRSFVWAFRVVAGVPGSYAMMRGYLAALLAVPTY